MLVQLHDTPHAIAGGVALGIFVGFLPPFLPIKTLLSIFLAWIFRCSKVAAAIAVTAHDLLFPIWPIILRWEYIIGYWLLHHQMPPKLNIGHHHRVRPEALFSWENYRNWPQWLHGWKEWIHERHEPQFCRKILGPTLIRCVIIGIPCSAICYAITLQIVKRTQAAKLARESEGDLSSANSSPWAGLSIEFAAGLPLGRKICLI